MIKLLKRNKKTKFFCPPKSLVYNDPGMERTCF